MAFVNVTLIDKEGNTGTFGYGLLDAANEAAAHALIDPLTLGTTKQRTIIASRIPGDDTLPSSIWAQVGLKLRFHWVDDETNESGFYSLPCANLDGLDIVGNRVSVDGSLQALQDLVADINLNWASPAGNAITLNYIEVVTVNR